MADFFKWFKKGPVSYPAPDRSRQLEKILSRPSHEGVYELGWNQGMLSDGRSFYLETWAQDQSTFVTFFFSTAGLERATADTLAGIVERDNLIRFETPERHVSAVKIEDDAGQAMWSFTVTLGTDQTLYAFDTVGMKPYAKNIRIAAGI